MAGRRQINGVTELILLRLKKKRSYFNSMKKLFVLLTVLGLLVTPAMAGTRLEKGKAHKQRTKHVEKHQKKHANKKVAKHNAKKHKAVV